MPRSASENQPSFARLTAVAGVLALLCPAVATAGPDIQLQGVVRDFSSTHADFDVAATGHVAGNVGPTLGPDYRPFPRTRLAPVPPPAIDPVAAWSFDEGAGTTTSDAAGTHTGALINGVAWTPGVQGNGVTFDGVNDYIEVPHHSDFMLDGVTVAMWIRPDRVNGRQGVVSKDSQNYDDGGHFTTFIWDGSIRVRLQSTTASYYVQSAPGSVVAGQWYHMAFTFGPDGMTLLIDGELVDSNPYTGGMGTTSGGSGNPEPWCFGANAWITDDASNTGLIEYFKGSVDEIRIFNGQLPEASFVEVIEGYQVAMQWRDESGNFIAPHTALTATNVCGTPVNDVAGIRGIDDSGGIAAMSTFQQWYDDLLGVNLSGHHSITLTDDGSGTYVFEDLDFFPIDDALIGNEGAVHNYGFTYQLEAAFTYSACSDQFIEFEGNDGCWIYVDGRLVIDVGGVLPFGRQRAGLDRLGLTDGATYPIQIFYAQRNTAMAQFTLRTNALLTPTAPAGVTVGYD